MNRWTRFLGSFLSWSTLAFVSLTVYAGPTLPTGVEKLTTVEGISEYRLQNGLHFVLFPDAAKPTVTVNVTYLVGSHQIGRAHV